MRLANVVADLASAVNPRVWRSPYDFESPELSPRERLERLGYAADQASRQSCEQAERDELQFALAECRALLGLGSLEGEVAERERVQQRMSRAMRVVRYHEGHLTRMNRRFWWIPFGMGVALMLSCCIQEIAGL